VERVGRWSGQQDHTAPQCPERSHRCCGRHEACGHQGYKDPAVKHSKQDEQEREGNVSSGGWGEMSMGGVTETGLISSSVLFGVGQLMYGMSVVFW
jgi:hypothetical protein